MTKNKNRYLFCCLSIRQHELLMKYIFTSIILLSFQSIFAQIDWKPDQYQGIPSTSKKVIFFDDFSATDESWKKSDFQRTDMDIEDGKCDLSASKGNQYIWQDLIMDKDGYDFEVKLSSTKNKSKEPLKIVLKGSKTEMLILNIFPKGDYSIVWSQRGKETAIQEKRSSVYIEESSNKVLVREVDGALYLFINEKFVTSMSVPSLEGYRFGVLATPKNPVTIDYVIMSDLIKLKRNIDFGTKGDAMIDKEERSKYKMD